MDQNEMYEQQQMQLAMLEEQMSGPQAVRYDDVYYPRTDKRAISKSNILFSSAKISFWLSESVTVSALIEGNQYTYKGNKYYATAANKEAVQDNINMTILNQEIGKSPIEYTNQLSRAKIYDMKGIRV